MLPEKATAHGQDYQRICHGGKERNFIQVSSRKHCAHGDDTDLLILLCCYTEMSVEELFFQCEPRANSTK